MVAQQIQLPTVLAHCVLEALLADFQCFTVFAVRFEGAEDVVVQRVLYAVKTRFRSVRRIRHGFQQFGGIELGAPSTHYQFGERVVQASPVRV